MKPTRKSIRLKEYDYSSCGTYFVTICTKDRKSILWEQAVGAATCRPQNVPLSDYGKVVDSVITQICTHYPTISVDHYCIMPDHIHLLLAFQAADGGRQVAAPTLSTVVGQLKRICSTQAGVSLWQKSFYDRVMRNEKEYLAAWQYIENNPLQPDTATDQPDFSNFT